MKTSEVIQAWKSVLSGRRPSLAIEITRECPLRCPGCYAYEEGHVGGLNLRQLQDKRGDDLVQGVLALVDEHRPLHLSLVGGDPLVRHREVTRLLPILSSRGIYVQVVTSAFRQIPPEWANIDRLNIVVSIDGLQPEHDERRKPATYARILESIRGHQVTVHCTITGQMMQRPSYLRDFVAFWSAKSEIRKIWMSMFTPQVGATGPEILKREERVRAVKELLGLRRLFPKLDMPEGLLQEFLHPPESPEVCVFAQTTHTISADLKSKITPCQFGGTPDCSQCGCFASMGLAAVGNHKLALGLTAGDIYWASNSIGKILPRNKRAA
ncbi:MAG TPA: radical SAM protein [Candidatus Dormibacteraeota bacterium]|jgi:sulfatase maturation enzyme AslB (radical SAM superfamily)|nr:radical SAM protein [Candidatus Dormibacteraeota bacterium]